MPDSAIMAAKVPRCYLPFYAVPRKEQRKPGDRITITIIGADRRTKIRMKLRVPFIKIRILYCIENFGIRLSTISFRYYGVLVRDEDTPMSLDMDDGDEVEVYQPKMPVVKAVSKVPSREESEEKQPSVPLSRVKPTLPCIQKKLTPLKIPPRISRFCRSNLNDFQC